jgi:hypothetical protein
MHPIVIMAYDKSPAITKAVAALEEAGLEVRVLNTNHAKLADFLGALAGEDDEDDSDKEPKEEPKDEPKPEAPTDDVPVDDAIEEIPFATESRIGFVDGEEILVESVDGPSELHPNGLMVGTKTAYAINESHFSFWPVQNAGDGLFDLTHQVQIAFDDRAVFEDVVIKEAAEKPVLKLNKEVFAKLKG